MKVFLLVLFLVNLTPALGEKSSRWMRDYHTSPDDPWLGVRLKWLEKETAAQLHEVPKGFGLLVDSVEPDSPAAEIGLESLDVLWKYDDQLVANKGQLFALMKLTGVGEEGILTLSRRGESLVLPVTLGMRPIGKGQKDLAEGAAEVLMPPLSGAILRQLDLGKRSAFIKEGEVTVSLLKKAGGYSYQVSDGEKALEEGELKGEDSELWPSSIDEKTRRKLQVLLQSLTDAEEREAKAPRQPRVRRVPVPKQEKKE